MDVPSNLASLAKAHHPLQVGLQIDRELVAEHQIHLPGQEQVIHCGQQAVFSSVWNPGDPWGRSWGWILRGSSWGRGLRGESDPSRFARCR